ncbi:hypothetical protein LY76DRAFT_208959 [Colletotrichum caudatum]|nr:hypothetical protein LY76DRAFT_208959 [Colletotrichum caudatum]
MNEGMNGRPIMSGKQKKADQTGYHVVPVGFSDLLGFKPPCSLSGRPDPAGREDGDRWAANWPLSGGQGRGRPFQSRAFHRSRSLKTLDGRPPPLPWFAPWTAADACARWALLDNASRWLLQHARVAFFFFFSGAGGIHWPADIQALVGSVRPTYAAASAVCGLHTPCPNITHAFLKGPGSALLRRLGDPPHRLILVLIMYMVHSKYASMHP